MYKILKNKKTKNFEAIEVASDNVISKFSSYDEARNFYKYLKSGKGFTAFGWTPSSF